MSRRAFLKTLTVLVGCFALPVAAHASIRGEAWKTLQTSPIARFQYHNGETLWTHLIVRPEPVEGSLTRETDLFPLAGYSGTIVKVKTQAEDRLRTHLMKRHKISDRGTALKRFPRQKLYANYGLYQVPKTAVWKTAHALA